MNDEIITIMILEEQLTKLVGVKSENVQRAHNGKDAYDKAICGSYDLIIMDLNMPVMGGFEATTKIK